LLARYFLSHFELNGRSRSLSDEATDALSHYSWPGNVRELKEALEFAVAHSVDGAILPSHFPEAIAKGSGAGTEDEAFASSELNLARLNGRRSCARCNRAASTKRNRRVCWASARPRCTASSKEMSGKT